MTGGDKKKRVRDQTMTECDAHTQALTDEWTDEQTNRLTDQPMKQSIEMRRKCWIHLKKKNKKKKSKSKISTKGECRDGGVLSRGSIETDIYIFFF